MTQTQADHQPARTPIPSGKSAAEVRAAFIVHDDDLGLHPAQFADLIGVEHEAVARLHAQRGRRTGEGVDEADLQHVVFGRGGHVLRQRRGGQPEGQQGRGEQCGLVGHGELPLVVSVAASPSLFLSRFRRSGSARPVH